MGILETILIICLVLYLFGFVFGGSTAGYRTFGNGVGYPSIGAILVVLLVLYLLHVI